MAESTVSRGNRIKANEKSRRERLRLAGICTQCGDEHDRGTLRCLACTRAAGEAIRHRHAAKKDLPWDTPENRARFDEMWVAEPTTGCHLWVGSLKDTGYGQFSINERPCKAHHVAWVLAGKKLPKGKSLLHKCDVRSCVNVDHLYEGTLQQNNRDKAMRYRRPTPGPLPLGVRKQKGTKRYGAYIKIKKKYVHLGMHDTIDQAHRAHLEAKGKEYGPACVAEQLAALDAKRDRAA